MERPDMIDLRLREARHEDAAALSVLLGQLGYPSSEEDVRDRLARVAASERRAVTVAALGGQVAGFSVGEVHDVLTSSEPVAKLHLLVVNESVRGQGIGRALLRSFEDWARERGALRLSLTSASHRREAHAFYRAAGWAETGARFGKVLEP